MQFCPICDNALFIKRKGKAKVLQCPSCGNKIPFNEEHKRFYTISTVIEHGPKDMTHIAEETTGPAVTEDDRELLDEDEFEYQED
ncbi:MAG: hypothetical protein JW839_13660 [Candidatus Lokiarchaeota archaeon]|nr:hypothetical protein [Candidatus Lokiarchaeota archaeon]